MENAEVKLKNNESLRSRVAENLRNYLEDAGYEAKALEAIEA